MTSSTISATGIGLISYATARTLEIDTGANVNVQKPRASSRR